METYITTSIFRHRASIVGKRAALLWLSRRGWPIWIAIIVLLFLGMAVSPLFYLVGLMAAFLVFPTVMMLAYYHYMLSPEARKAILPQSIYFGNESFTVNYFSYDMGAFHFVSRGVGLEIWNGISTMMFSVLSGVMYLRLNRKYLYSYLFIAIGYLL